MRIDGCIFVSSVGLYLWLYIRDYNMDISIYIYQFRYIPYSSLHIDHFCLTIEYYNCSFTLKKNCS